MSDSSELGSIPDSFTGTVRLFPLPNFVMFPHVVQSLHVYEPRYREMLEDALQHDELLTMALMQPGWEKSYDDRPSIYPVTCVGRVMTHSRLKDGCYNILLLGLRRATVIRELPAGRVVSARGSDLTGRPLSLGRCQPAAQVATRAVAML